MERLVRTPIDARQVAGLVRHEGAGAVLLFEGTVRDHNRGRTVVEIEYHAYETMAVREIEKIERETTARWPEVRVAIVHRLGVLRPGEASVVIAVASPHRAEGFEALRHAIEALKKDVPIWKRERYTDGEAWLEGS